MVNLIKNRDEIRSYEFRDYVLDSIEETLLLIRGDKILRDRIRIVDDCIKFENRCEKLTEDIYVFGFGKAAGEMAAALETMLGRRVKGGMINTDHSVSLERLTINHATHPLPDEDTVENSRKTLEYLKSLPEDAMVIFLITGGASSMFEVPSVPLHIYRERVGEAMRRGLDIIHLNALRRKLSLVKGGKLLNYVRGKCISIIISDVPGNPEWVGSGPTFRGVNNNCLNWVIADNRYAQNILLKSLAKRGIKATRVEEYITGDILSAVNKFEKMCRTGKSLVAGGEITVDLRGGVGSGGRAMEFALRMARRFSGENMIFSAIGTDGRDGPTDACGAIVDGETAGIISDTGVDLNGVLSSHDSLHALKLSRDLIVTGPTGSNLADLYMCIWKS